MKARLYPIGIQSFEEIRKGVYIYIDKTKFVYDIANTDSSATDLDALLTESMMRPLRCIDAIRKAINICIMEFKLDKSQKEAIKQINTNNYLIPYSQDKKKVMKVGFNFSSENRTIES